MTFLDGKMAKANWGRKRVCLECEASFYDMRRNPIACPKCGKTHRPVALLKSDGRAAPRKSRIPETVTQAVVAEAEVVPAGAEDEGLDDALPESGEHEDEVEDEEAESIGDGRDL